MRLLLLICVVACNQVYGVDPTVLETFDRDGDAIEDALDNCADVENADQNDEDHDLIGDRCDNCPLIANAGQKEVGDDDGIGDACDPRPDSAGDCLIVFDSFLDPAGFKLHWQVLAETGDTPDVRSEVGFVTITPHAKLTVTLTARDNDGSVLTGAYDVQVAARSAPLVEYGAAIGAVSNAAHAGGGYGCSLFGNDEEVVVISSEGTPLGSGGMSSEPVNEPLLLRLALDGLTVRCRVEHGVSIGYFEATAQTALSGGPGVFVRQIEAHIDAVAVYQVRPDTCPEVTWR